MMTAKEIAAILIAFDEGKRVVRSLNVRGIRDNEQALEIVWLITEISDGAHFEVAREPMVRWIPSFDKEVADEPFSVFSSKESCDAWWESKDGAYTGAVQFKEVIEP